MLFSFSFFLSNQIFIFENNIYYCAHVGKQAIRVVSTGKEGVIFNGLSDWLYEGRTQPLGWQLAMIFVHSQSAEPSGIKCSVLHFWELVNVC